MILRHNIRPNILYSHQARIMKVQAPPSGSQGPTGPSLGPEWGALPALNLAQSDPECRKGGPGLS